jgi:hypothetical protein
MNFQGPIMKRFLITAATLTLLVLNSHAAEIKDVQFEDQVVINGVELKLNGLAVLKWAMLFDVYAGGFYLPDGVPGLTWTDDVAKKLELSYFRDIEAKGFADASDKLLKENLSAENYAKLAERLTKFYGFFRDVKPGDRYSINYVPENGTELKLNGDVMGSVPGHDFAVAYFGIWLGDKPINKTFRDKLLDGQQ